MQPNCEQDKISKLLLDSLYVDNKKIHKGAFAIFGNAKTKKKYFASAGEASKGKKFRSSTIIRFASQSKLLGATIFAKAFEEGILPIQDSVSEYLPEFDRELSYYKNDEGTEIGKFDGKIVTVGHLMSMSTGLGYYFSNWGFLYNIFPPAMQTDGPLAKKNKVRNDLISKTLKERGMFWDWQFDPSIEKISTLPSMKKYVDVLTTVPLLFKPGTNSSRGAVYGMDFDVLGAVVSVALKRNLGVTVWEYFKDRFLCPMNIDSFFYVGSEEKPCDLEERFADCPFRRPSENKQPDGTEFAPDPSEEYLSQSANEIAWTSDYPSDGFRYNHSIYTRIRVEPDEYAGYFGAGYAGTPSDYCKFFELLVGKGVFRGKRLLSENSVSFIFTSSLPENRSFGLATVVGDWTDSLAKDADVNKVGLLSFTYNESWCLGQVRGNHAFTDALLDKPAISSSVFRWGSYYGPEYFCDLETGNYVVAGIQEDANSLKVAGDTSSALAFNIFTMLQNQ
jgi:CubicO group peptidase (beta-lactamase class C family)